MFVDSHCHLNYQDINKDLANYMQQADDAKIEHMLCIATKIKEIEQCLDIAKQYKNVSIAIGVHPHHSEETKGDLSMLENYITESNVVAIGETGLDFFYEYSQKSAQIYCFNEQINIAKEYDLPVIIHSRDAEKETVDILAQEMAKKEFSAVLHCFSSSQYLADACLEMGIYVSFSGIVTFKNAKQVQDVALSVPSDKLLIETDAPFLSPNPVRGKINHPAHVVHVAQFLAQLRGETIEDIAKTTTSNFYNLFSKINKNEA